MLSNELIPIVNIITTYIKEARLVGATNLESVLDQINSLAIQDKLDLRKQIDSIVANALRPYQESENITPRQMFVNGAVAVATIASGFLEYQTSGSFAKTAIQTIGNVGRNAAAIFVAQHLRNNYQKTKAEFQFEERAAIFREALLDRPKNNSRGFTQ